MSYDNIVGMPDNFMVRHCVSCEGMKKISECNSCRIYFKKSRKRLKRSFLKNKISFEEYSFRHKILGGIKK